jgi:hypothetical protein
VVVSIQNLTRCPVLPGPSQNCRGPMAMFPDAGTTRSISTASGHRTGSAVTAVSGKLFRQNHREDRVDGPAADP